MKRKLIILFVVATAGFCAPIFAQPAGGPPPGGPTGGTDPPCWPPPCIPVDGGVSILIALGAAYGGKKAYDHLKSDNKSDNTLA